MKVFSLFSCSWCEEIREKYWLRYDIAKRLNLDREIVDEFEQLAKYAKCPIHRKITVMPQEQYTIHKAEIVVQGNVILHWWSNQNEYRALFHLPTKQYALVINNRAHVGSSYKVNEPVKLSNEFIECLENMGFTVTIWDSVIFDFKQDFIETLKLCDKKTLEKIKEILKDNIREKALRLIIARLIWEGVRKDDKITVRLHCSDKPVTHILQGKIYEDQNWIIRKNFEYVEAIKK